MWNLSSSASTAGQAVHIYQHNISSGRCNCTWIAFSTLGFLIRVTIVILVLSHRVSRVPNRHTPAHRAL